MSNDCDHASIIKLTATTSGKSRSFCADCLYEKDAHKSSAPAVVPEGGFEPYTKEMVSLLESGKLTEWESDFLPSLAKMRTGPTDKQMVIWTKIVRKYFPGGTPARVAAAALPENKDDFPF